MNIAVEPAGKWGYPETEKSVVENWVWLYKMINSIKNQLSIELHIYIQEFSQNFQNIKQFIAHTRKIVPQFCLISCKLIGTHESLQNSH